MGIFSKIFRRRRQDDSSAPPIDGATITIDEHESPVTESPALSSHLRQRPRLPETLLPTVTTGNETSTSAESVGGAERVVDEFSLPDIDDADDLEATGLRVEYSSKLTPDEATALKLMRLIHESTFSQNLRDVTDELVNIEVFGRLPGGGFAWVGPNGIAGAIMVTRLNDWEIAVGDEIRARVSWRPWHCQVHAVALPTLRRKGAERRPVVLVDQRPRFGDFLDELEPGDVVIAYISYGPHAPTDALGNTGKKRPVVFAGWSPESYARVRGVYTAEKDRYVVRNGGIILADPTHIFDKPRVAVKPTIVEISNEHITKKIGRLTEGDLGRIGMGGRGGPRTSSPKPAGPATASSTVVPPPPKAPTPRPAVAPQMFPVDQKRYLDRLAEEFEKDKPRDWASVIRRFLVDFTDNRIGDEPSHPGRLYVSTLGNLASQLRLGHLPSRPRPFGKFVESVIDGGNLSRVKYHVSGATIPQPWLERLATPATRGGEAGDGPTLNVHLDDNVHLDHVVAGEKTPSYSEYVTDDETGDDFLYEISYDDELPVVAVLVDQQWTYLELGDRRVDLALMRQSLSEGQPDVQAWLIGKTNDGLAGLHHAAQQRGYMSMEASTREMVVASALQITEVLDPGIIKVVSAFSDIFKALENVGWETVEVTDISGFVID